METVTRIGERSRDKPPGPLSTHHSNLSPLSSLVHGVLLLETYLGPDSHFYPPNLLPPKPSLAPTGTWVPSLLRLLSIYRVILRFLRNLRGPTSKVPVLKI